MSKCHICKGKIETTFLNKIKGTYINKKLICMNCQKQYSIDELKEKTE